jgi:hypothetical protein
MHTVTLIRMRLDPTTKAYVTRRITGGIAAASKDPVLPRVAIASRRGDQ